jgi:hypothetical protein
MPRVGGKEYPYTPAGMAAADYAKKKKKRKAKPAARKALKRVSSPRTLKNVRAYGKRNTPKSRRGR